MHVLTQNQQQANLHRPTAQPQQRWRFKSMRPLEFISLVLLALAVQCPVSQGAFTRLLEGDIANDEGYFMGCAWGDYDNDGYVDLVVGGGFSATITNRLYHNNRDGTFTRITTGKIPNEAANTCAPVWGDFDNDGNLDLFCANFGAPPGYSAPSARDFFYHNEGNGTFTKITQGTWVTDSAYGEGAAWGDYDNDGFLDLYVANSIGSKGFLYHNNVDGTMTRMINAPGIEAYYSCSWADYDGDGDLDLLIAGGADRALYQNNGNGTFTRITKGVLVTSDGWVSGVAWADYDNDGDLDVIFGNVWQGDKNERLYRNDGPAGFTRITEGEIVNAGGDSNGVAWGDYDNDGYLDLFVANTYDQGNVLYHNEGDGTFSPVTEGASATDYARSFGCAWADYDNDGYLDLYVANGAYDEMPMPAPQASFLYHNDGGTNNWLKLKLVGTASNRAAIGAKVRVLATLRGKKLWQLREISGGGVGHGCQNELRAHFGLGDAPQADTVRIEWPSGIVQELSNVGAKQILTITEQQTGTTSPPSLAAAPTTSGAVQLTVTGQTNRLYVIEASTNFVQWTKIAVRTNMTGSVSITNSVSAKFPQRFYRAVVP
jgi:enediyne biosynthesis protein E4